MKAMLLKDLLLIRRQYAKLLMILFICILAGSIISTDLTSVYLPFIAFFICSLALSTFSMDENNHGYQTILSFPIQRKEYIQSKYLLFLLLFFGCILLFLPVYLFSLQINDLYLLLGICGAAYLLFFALALLLIAAFGPYKDVLL
jgi:ABC-type transport system involved in multi-copper enzyme maturation permease subunit